jgi:LysM repeat protein
MPKRPLWLVAVVLIAASLACSLSSGGDEEPKPIDTATPAPTAISALPTPTPANTAAPTQAPAATAAPIQTSAPNCTVRSDWPTLVVNNGDTLSGIALATGSTVQALVTANCLNNANAIEAGQRLHVPALPPPIPVPTPAQLCGNKWFFTFAQGKWDLLGTCPDPVIQVDAVGQDFEGGRAYWYAALPGSSDPRGTVWVIYNDGYWVTYPDTWQTGEMESDPGITPPTGRYQPVQRIGKVWRDNADVRAKLGWAYSPQQAFTGRMQWPSGSDAVWAGQTRYWYIDHGAWGLVLRVYSVDMGPNVWEVAGEY